MKWILIPIGIIAAIALLVYFGIIDLNQLLAIDPMMIDEVGSAGS